MVAARWFLALACAFAVQTGGAAAVDDDPRVVRCLQLAALYERYVAKTATATSTPSVAVSVAIERCRQGRADGALETLESALRAQGFRI
ncbi:MAG: hypothetical protein IPK81_04030 [Rhodospirillales bacterium]|nr:MAG: hypothetical protein IPK81_04030 [Rhodospirillales bacterium]